MKDGRNTVVIQEKKDVKKDLYMMLLENME